MDAATVTGDRTKCEVCGGPLKADATHGVCQRNPTCKRENVARKTACIRGTPTTRFDFLCHDCGHTVPVLNDSGEKVSVKHCRPNCPKCGSIHACAPILAVDMALEPTHRLVVDGRRIGVKRMTEVVA